MSSTLRPFSPAVKPFEPETLREVSRLLYTLFRDFEGVIHIQLWNGDLIRLGKDRLSDTEPEFTLHLNNEKAVNALTVGNDPLRLAECYFRDDINITGDFSCALSLIKHFQSMEPTLSQRLKAYFAILNWSLYDIQKQAVVKTLEAIQSPRVKNHSREENQRSVEFHYDISNDFYKLWLDSNMLYSCAYFKHVNDSLEIAQQQKMDHICKKLLLKPGDELLDIGCGWGALAMHAAQKYGAKVHGITLSKSQWEWANQALLRRGLGKMVRIDLCDYRDLQGASRYDKISSVGMFEHVGLKNLPTYFAIIHRLLKPNGLMLNHGITHEQEGWASQLSSRFINRYVFPDGELDSVSNVQLAIERSHFEIADVENLRQHYAMTLRHWVSRLESKHEIATEYVSEATFRIWRLFMAASASEFESGQLGLYQILACKRDGQPMPLPLTRDHLYQAPKQAPQLGLKDHNLSIW
jgi:cyclopropane-fatty-acyl-phospholipid synthase